MTISSLTEPDHANRRLETTAASAVGSPSITVETALYAGVFGVALFLRLFRLGLAPLSETEAAQALAALRAGVLPAGGSPMLYILNAFLLSLFSAGDGILRLAPALAGSLIVLAPAFFRDSLGRFGALGASLILALSPLGLVASRSLDGEVLVVGCVLAVIALARRYLSTGDDRHLIGAAIAMGVGLAAGPGMYTALAATGAGLIVLRFALGGESDTARQSAWRSIRESSNRSKIAAGLVGAFVLTATGGLTHPAGLGSAGDLLTAWLNAFGAPGGSPAFDIFQVLIVYETLALLAGVAGLVRTLLRYRRLSPVPQDQATHELPDKESGDVFGPWLGFVAVAAVAIVIMQSGRRPIDLLLPVTLLALLAAYAIQPWAEAVHAKASLAVDGVVLSVGFTVTAFLMLTVTAFLRGRITPATFLGVVVPSELAILTTSLIAIGVVAGLLAMMYGAQSVQRGAATLALLVLVLGSFGAGWGATQVRIGDAREVVWGPSVTAPGVYALTDLASQIAVRAQGHTGTLPIRVEVDDPVVGWYLRDARVPSGEAPAGIVTGFGDQPRSTDGDYIGARFNVRETWHTLGLNLDAWLEWALFRTSATAPSQVVQAVTLWEKR